MPRPFTPEALAAFLKGDRAARLVAVVAMSGGDLRALSPAQALPANFPAKPTSLLAIDDGGEVGGPRTFDKSSLRQAFTHADRVVIVSGPALAGAAEEVTCGAAALSRCVLITTRPDRAPAWCARIAMLAPRLAVWHFENFVAG